MPFNSYEFIFVFAPLSVVGFWLLARFAGRTAALGWLALASMVFYAYASLESLAIIAPSILLDYLISILILRTDPTREGLRTALFAAGVAVNIAFLCYFKYKNFFLDTANSLFGAHFSLAPLILPLGISFLTFQKIGFLADVQSGRVKTVRLLDFLLFTLFFPRALAGPIVHYEEVMPQFSDAPARRIMANVVAGLFLFSIGLFKKTVIADGVAPFVPAAFDVPGPAGLLTAWVGVLAYVFQLYFDFSGYSDMALGAARLFGVRLPMNFNSPLKATSILEFWSRWHITLTRFLTAYIYTPIVLHLTRARMAKGKPVLWGKRSTPAAIAILVGLPTLITMAISGLWHGAGWQFIVWGLLHGIYLTINQSWRMLRPRFWADQTSYERVMKPLGFVLTFSAVVLSLIFFRASSVTSAWSILGDMVGTHGIAPATVQELRLLGARFDWMPLWQPFAPFKWIVVLFLAVTLLPNSLELLRRFQPALDFPEDSAQGPERQVALSASVPRFAGANAPSAAAKLRTLWVTIARDGIAVTRPMAWLAALLFVLGVMTLNRGGTFLYGAF
jgi:D-alanyl-lipoteichoic acid acyltransferase DltB (MBOAT superfamily)